MSDDASANNDAIDQTRRLYGAEWYGVCDKAVAELLPEWAPGADNDDTVEITPDGFAVIDGAFSAHDLMRVAEAIGEVMRRCEQGTGLKGPTVDPPPQPLLALQRLRFLLGPDALAGVRTALDACERGVWMQGKTLIQQSYVLDKMRQALGHRDAKIAAIAAIVEAQRRALAVGGTISADPVLIEKLQEILA